MKTKGSSFLYGGIEMNTTNTFIKVAEIQEIFDISESKAYRIVRSLNKELESKGYMVIKCQDPMYKKYYIKMYN